MRARSAAQATVRALGRTRLGRPSFPTVSSGPKEQRPVPVLLLRPQLILGTSPKIQGVRSEARAEQRLAAGGAAPPTRITTQPNCLSAGGAAPPTRITTQPNCLSAGGAAPPTR